ncbi:MAG: hypothetical protein H6732_11130 [Alphaproteobacteria bacterium]|nr:hypothetical protein [Alphaproteobacteria bacterium]
MRTLPFLLVLACAPSDPDAGDTDTGVDTGPSLDGDNLGVVESRGEEGCDNLVASSCLLPFPSDAWVASTPDGLRVRLTPEAMPVPAGGGSFSTAAFDRFEGFGAATPLLFQLEGAVPPAATAPFDLAASVADDSPTLLLDAATGERIPHWLEADSLAPDADPPILTLRPAVPLPRGTWVVAAVRDLRDAEGVPVPAPEAFVALRDREASTWRGVHARRAHFEEVVFPALEDAGVARQDLQLAWSFPVRSDADATRALLAVRDAVFAALPPEGPRYTLDEVRVCTPPSPPSGCPSGIRVVIDGTVEVPSVVLPADALGVRLVRRASDGSPVVDGAERRAFRLQLPHVAFDGSDPVPVLQYGHGFLGSRGEADNGWLRSQAQRLGHAILAMDLQGMDSGTLDVWLDVVTQDGGRFPELSELSLQGVANQLVLQRLVGTSLAASDDARLRRADDRLAWDPGTVWYAGNSQGGSVGSLMVATSLDSPRGVLGVPGSGYPLLLHRSTVFAPASLAIRLVYQEPDSISRFLALLGTGWDDVDPLTFGVHLHGDPLPGTPDHEVLLHVAREDQQVVNEASFILGRAAGAVLMTPAVRPVEGLAPQTYPASPGAALVEVDFSVPLDPTPRTPASPAEGVLDENDTHGWLRAWPPAQDQLVHFLRTGEVIDVCQGAPCVVDGRP